MSIKIKPGTGIIAFLLITVLQLQALAQDTTPIMSWDFSEIKNRNVIEQQSGISDTLEGYFGIAPGIDGQGLRLDGFTAQIIRERKDVKTPADDFTIEAWVALGEYPVNWCPIITTESNEKKGYRLLVGPYGQVSFETAISEQWVSSTSANETIPLRKWMHIVGVYKAQDEIALYVNGTLISSVEIKGEITHTTKSNYILGMVADPRRPSNTIRTWGTVPTYYGLNGIIDEVHVYDKALTAETVKNTFAKHEVKTQTPDILARRLPTVEHNPGQFGAYYTKLKYYPAWDRLWPVDQDPDIVVFFDNNPSKLIFWRGIRYGPSWVSENENWMADQSLETWGLGDKDIEGCFEHMQDRHCRFSHVRMIEKSEARAVVHWRYAPVSSKDNTWLPDPKTGWELWVDEYYYIYPDGSAIRKVLWNKETTGPAVQLQESLPLTQPGQTAEDVVEHDYVTVSDYDYNKRSVSVDLLKQPADWEKTFTVQQYNFKSENKPFLMLEPGNIMTIRHIGGGYNHFPVNQVRSDGRWAKTTDRPTHFMSSPCSHPVIHEDGNRLYWIGLYGMNDMEMDELVSYGRSWAYAPELSLSTKGFISNGYDRVQRCYQLEKTAPKSKKLNFKLDASKENPVFNPAFVIKNWDAQNATITVNGKPAKDARIDVTHQLEGSQLVVFLFLEKNKPVEISIAE